MKENIYNGTSFIVALTYVPATVAQMEELLFNSDDLYTMWSLYLKNREIRFKSSNKNLANMMFKEIKGIKPFINIKLLKKTLMSKNVTIIGKDAPRYTDFGDLKKYLDARKEYAKKIVQSFFKKEQFVFNISAKPDDPWPKKMFKKIKKIEIVA